MEENCCIVLFGVIKFLCSCEETLVGEKIRLEDLPNHRLNVLFKIAVYLQKFGASDYNTTASHTSPENQKPLIATPAPTYNQRHQVIQESLHPLLPQQAPLTTISAVSIQETQPQTQTAILPINPPPPLDLPLHLPSHSNSTHAMRHPAAIAVVVWCGGFGFTHASVASSLPYHHTRQSQKRHRRWMARFCDRGRCEYETRRNRTRQSRGSVAGAGVVVL